MQNKRLQSNKQSKLRGCSVVPGQLNLPPGDGTLKEEMEVSDNPGAEQSKSGQMEWSASRAASLIKGC